MAKQKKHLLEFETETDYDLVGICSHHNDYRLAWGINAKLGFHLEQSAVPFFITLTKKGVTTHQSHAMFEFYEEENRVTYFLIKNKENGKFLIPEKPTVDFFLFIHKDNVVDLISLADKLRSVPSILAVFNLEPEDLPSTEQIIF
jgi:hypothetical protein